MQLFHVLSTECLSQCYFNPTFAPTLLFSFNWVPTSQHTNNLDCLYYDILLCSALTPLPRVAGASTLPACMHRLESCTCLEEEMEMLLLETSGSTSQVRLCARLSSDAWLQLATGGRWSEGPGHHLAACRDTPCWSTRMSSMSLVGSSASAMTRRHRSGCLTSRNF